MARIRSYEQDIGAGQEMPSARASLSSPVGEALSTFGNGAERAVDRMREAEDRQEVSDVHAKLARARGDWTGYLVQRAQEMQPGDTTFADKFTEDFGSYLDTIKGNIKTRSGQQAFDRISAQMAGEFVGKAATYQANSVGMKAKQDWVQTVDAFQTSLLADPTQLPMALAQADAALNDPNGYFAKVPAAVRGELATATRKQLSLSAAEGTIRLSPELFKGQVNQGQWDSLDPDAKNKLLDHADVVIKTKEAEKRSQALLAEHAQKLQKEKIFGDYMRRIVDPKGNGGYPSDSEIAANPNLDGEAIQRLATFKLTRANQLKEGTATKSNAQAVNSFAARLYAPDGSPDKIYDPNIIAQAAVNGTINAHELNFLMGMAGRVRDEGRQTEVARLRNAQADVSRAFRSNIVLNAMEMSQPGITADATNRVMMDFEESYAAAMKKNDGSHLDLLNAKSSSYFFTPERLRGYTPQSAGAGLDQAVSAGKGREGTVTGSSSRVKTPEPQYPTATNPKTGEKMILKDGKWQKP